MHYVSESPHMYRSTNVCVCDANSVAAGLLHDIISS